MFERFTSEASRLAQYNKHSAITSSEVQMVMCLLLQGKLAKHPVSEGTKAVTSIPAPTGALKSKRSFQSHLSQLEM